MNMRQVAEIEQAAREGVRTFKIFMPYRGEEARNLGGIGSLNHAQMRVAFAQIVAHGGQALVHAEDGDIVDAAMQVESAAGLDSLAGWERSRPTIAEGDAAWTALYLAEEAGCQVSIVHVSSLEAIKARKALGYAGAALESCVRYMVLSTDSDIGPEGKVAPPIRGLGLSEAITEAVLAGDIDFFGSDHNEWPSAAKVEWGTSKLGLPGIGLDGIYIIRTSVPEATMDAGTVVNTYKSLARVERDFRSIKSIDLDLRPIYHWTSDRVRAHVFICMLAAYLLWHLRKAWAPLTFTDEDRPDPIDPVAPAKRSTAAERKASTRADADGEPVRSFRSLLDHLATLTSNDIRYGTDPNTPTIPALATPTTIQRRAFELLGCPIPIGLK